MLFRDAKLAIPMTVVLSSGLGLGMHAFGGLQIDHGDANAPDHPLGYRLHASLHRDLCGRIVSPHASVKLPAGLFQGFLGSCYSLPSTPQPRPDRYLVLNVTRRGVAVPVGASKNSQNAQTSFNEGSARSSASVTACSKKSNPCRRASVARHAIVVNGTESLISSDEHSSHIHPLPQMSRLHFGGAAESSRRGPESP
jgi:hypothetical protein